MGSEFILDPFPLIPRLFNIEVLAGFVILVADLIVHRDHHAILSWADVGLQVEAHDAGHITLWVEGLALLDGRFRLRPQLLAAGRDHRHAVADLDGVILAILESCYVEAGPDRVSRPVGGLLQGLGILLSTVKAEIADDQRIARLDRMPADGKS